MGYSPWGRKESDTTERLHFHFHPLQYSWASLVAQMVKNPPALPVIWVHSLGWEDPLEKKMATHSNILAWRTPQTEEPDGLLSMGFSRQEYWSGVPLQMGS